MKSLAALSLGSFLVFALPAHAQGTVIAEHYGAHNPTTEGFKGVSAGNPSLAPVLNDMGRDGWFIGLNSDTDNGSYARNLNAQEQLSLSSGGWTMSLTLRILSPFSLPDTGIFADLQTGTEYFLITFGAQPDGDPIVGLRGTSYILDGAGAGYHNYQLRNDAGTGVTSLWVDRSPFLTAVAGSPNPFNAGFAWGGGQRPQGTTYANWNEASLSVIPEPASFLLMSLGGLVLATARFRLRAQR